MDGTEGAGPDKDGAEEGTTLLHGVASLSSYGQIEGILVSLAEVAGDKRMPINVTVTIEIRGEESRDDAQG